MSEKSYAICKVYLNCKNFSYISPRFEGWRSITNNFSRIAEKHYKMKTKVNIKQGRMHGSISRVWVGRGSMASGQGQ